MSQYTDSRSQPGKKGSAGTSDRELFLTEFGELVLQAYDESMSYDALRYIRRITQGKADDFPIIGRKRDASEHEPGEVILGGTIEHNARTITVDKVVYDSVFVAEIDELLNHFDLMAPYAKQIGQSLGSIQDKRIAIMHILSSRETTLAPQGQPAPAYYYASDLATNGAKLEEWAQLSRQYMLENDISGDTPKMMLPHRQMLLLAKYAGIEGGPVTTGSGNRSAGTVGPIMGLNLEGTNHIPNTNITTGNSKYQGNFSTTVGHVSSRMAVGSLELRSMKMVMKDVPERLGTLIIGSQVNGHGILRPECAIEGRTDAIGGRTALNA